MSRSSQSKHDNTIAKLEKIGMLEELEDTDMFLEGLRSSHEDHQTCNQGKERKEGLSLSGRKKSIDKVSITSTFNALHPLSWPH